MATSLIVAAVLAVGGRFSIAGSTLVGQHLGADDHDGAVRSGWRSAAYAIVSMGLLGWLIAYFADELASFFLAGDPRTVELTATMVVLMGLATPLLAVDFAIGGSLRGAGDTRFPLVATFVGLIGVRCTLAAAVRRPPRKSRLRPAVAPSRSTPGPVSPGKNRGRPDWLPARATRTRVRGPPVSSA